ncbi:hypothetical protein D3C83_182940 [compost metagenome]
MAKKDLAELQAKSWQEYAPPEERVARPPLKTPDGKTPDGKTPDGVPAFAGTTVSAA